MNEENELPGKDLREDFCQKKVYAKVLRWEWAGW